MEAPNRVSRGTTTQLKAAIVLLCIAGVGAWILLRLFPESSVYLEQAPDRFVRIFDARGNEYTMLLGLLLIFWVQFSNKQWLRATITFLIAAFWLVYSESLVFWLNGLGADSFSEAQNFDWREAIFFVKTLPSVLSPIYPYRRLTIDLILGIALLWSLGWVRRALGISRERYQQAQMLAGGVIVALPLVHIATVAYRSAVDNTALYRQTTQNFDHVIAPIAFPNSIKVVVYIGESTSAMNFGVYGYPRATTPQLLRLRSEDPGLILFDNVMTTFTHTSQSLLETLSIGLDTSQNVQPIMSRQRVSLVELLAESQVPAFLLSNQGETGTWNMASRIVFSKAKRTYSVKSGAAGNADFKIPRPYDLDFFAPELAVLLRALPGKSPAVIFLHSYAGHGGLDGYLGALPPEFRGKVDDFLSNRLPVQIFGDVINQPLVTGLTQGVEDYDAAMRYVDFSISQIIAQVSKVDEPIVYLYFSDHGESSFTASGHESSRFKLEMGRVPFVMYFNQAARKQYAGLYAKYRSLSAGTSISTLAQVPATVIDLLGGSEQARRELPELTGVIGDPAGKPLPPVLVRSTGSGDTFVSLSNTESIASPLAPGGIVTNAADDATRVFIARQTRALAPTLLCYGNADTLASALRGALAGDCLGIALANGDAGSFTTSLGAGQPPGPDLASILRIVEPQKRSLWIDATTAGLPGSCESLGKALAADGQASTRTIGFPVNALRPDSALLACAGKLRDLGLRVALQIPSGQLLSCAANSPASAKVCNDLDSEVRAAIASGNFTDLAFERSAEAGMRGVPSASTLPQTVTGVAPRDLPSILPGRYRMVVVTPADANRVR